jgi:hypothetical protein
VPLALPAVSSTPAIVEREFGNAALETPVKTTNQYYTHSNMHASSPHVVTLSTPIPAKASSSSSVQLPPPPPPQQHQHQQHQHQHKHKQGYARHTGGLHQQASFQPSNGYYQNQNQHHQQMQHEHKHSQYGKYGWQQQQKQHYSPQHAGRPPYAQYAAYGSPGHMHKGYQQRYQQLQYQQQMHYQQHQLQHEPYHQHQHLHLDYPHPHLQEQHQQQYYLEYQQQAAQEQEQEQQQYEEYEEYEPHHRLDESSEGKVPSAEVAKGSDAALPPTTPATHLPPAERGMEKKLEPHEEQNKANEAIIGGEKAARGDGANVVSP